MSKSIEEFLKYAESRMSEIEMYDALIKEAMYKEAFDAKWWAHWLKPSTYMRKVFDPAWKSAYKGLVRDSKEIYRKTHDGSSVGLSDYVKSQRRRNIALANASLGKPKATLEEVGAAVDKPMTNWQFRVKPAPAPAATATTKTTPTPAPAAASTTKTTPAPATEPKPAESGAAPTETGTNAPARTEDVKVPGSEATKDPNLKWKALTYGGIPASAALTWLGTSSSSDLEEQNSSLAQQVNDYQKQIQQMRDSAQVGDSFANMSFFERLLFLLLGPAMFKYMGSGSSNL